MFCFSPLSPICREHFWISDFLLGQFSNMAHSEGQSIGTTDCCSQWVLAWKVVWGVQDASAAPDGQQMFEYSPESISRRTPWAKAGGFQFRFLYFAFNCGLTRDKIYEESTPGSPSSRLGDADIPSKKTCTPRLLSFPMSPLAQVAGCKSTCDNSAIHSSSDYSNSNNVRASSFLSPWRTPGAVL